MRVTIPAALLAATLLSGAAVGQGDRSQVELSGYAMATEPLAITHITPAGVEKDVVPAGLAFSTTPQGPACPHWPVYGCGAKYTWEKADHGYAYTYTGRDLVQVAPGEVGEAGTHDNMIAVMSRHVVPALVDLHIRSVVDAAFSFQFAVVQIGGQTIRHEFKPGFAETVVSVPVQLSPEGVAVHVKTLVWVDNTLQSTRSGLVDIGVEIDVRLPSATYETGGAQTCLGSNGVPFLSASNLPFIGSMFSVTAMNLPLDPFKPVYGLIGTRRFLPWDLAPIGMPSCYLHISSPIAVPIEKCCTTATWLLPIPIDMSLVGAEFYQQVFAIDESWVNRLGCVITDYGHGTIGAPPMVN